jgi:hypothetical protein
LPVFWSFEREREGGTAVDRIAGKMVGTDARRRLALITITGISGMLGALTMFVGDVLLYGPSAWGEPSLTYFTSVDPVASTPEALAASPMGQLTPERAIVGGLLGPVASIFYIIGCAQFILASPRPGYGRWIAAIGHGAAFVFVAVYHAAYTYTAFIAAFIAAAGQADLLLVGGHMSYMASLKSCIKFCGFIGTFGFLFALYENGSGSGSGCRSGCHQYPRWLACFAPSLWLMVVREAGMLHDLPAPYGHIVAGGSFNIAFFAFFAVATLSAAGMGGGGREEKTKEK